MTASPVLAHSLEVDAAELARFLGLRDHRFAELLAYHLRRRDKRSGNQP